MLKITLPLIVSMVFSLTSISYSQDTISAKYFPLSIGNTWVYSVQTNFPPFDDTMFKIERDSVFNGHRYFLCSGFSSSWIRYDSLTGNLLAYTLSNGCSNYTNDKIIDSLSSGVGDIINCQIQVISIRECTDISMQTIFSSYQRLTKSFEHDGLVLEEVTYAKDFGIIYSASGEPPPVSTSYILKGCVINGIGYGDTTLTSVRQISSTVPDNFSLSQNYPNPFNPVTVINYQIASKVKSQTSNVRLIIYNALGKEVATLVNENQRPGIYSVEFDGANLSSGIYFYKIESDDFVDTKRMILLK